jgi:polygalacturonase
MLLRIPSAWLGTLAACGLAAVAPAAEPGAGAAGKTYDVKAYGAAGDGKANDGPAIQKAIDAAGAGGGTVVLPAGTYLSGAVRLRSQVTLRLEKDAVLQASPLTPKPPKGAAPKASPDPAFFPPVKSRWEGTTAEYPSPLIVADGCRDVGLTGAGTVAGDVRAALFKDCRGVRVDGLTLTSNLRWTLHLLYCEGVVVENCRFITDGINTDGCDPDSSRDVVIRKCYFKTGDDCIAIKSGKNAEGVKIGRPCENIRIEDCVMEKGHGAVSIGSEMSGGVRNVTVARCDMSGCWAGVRLKTRKGRGGFMEDIRASDCRIRNCREALLVDTVYTFTAGSDLIPGPEGIPRIRRIAFADITGEGNKTPLALAGMPESPIVGLTLKNIKLAGGAPGRIENAEEVVAEGLTLDAPLKLANVKGTGLTPDGAAK